MDNQDVYAKYIHDLAESQRTPIVVPYYGGRVRASRFILPLLPPLPNFIQPFGGAGTMLIKRPRMKGREIYGDLSSGMVSLLTELRDEPELMIRKLRFTLFSQSLFEESKERMANGTATGVDAYVVHTQSWFAKSDGAWGVAMRGKAVKAHANANREGVAPTGPLPMDETPLYHSAMRLQGVEIRCADAFDLIREWKDDPSTLIHIDPPYLPEIRRSENDYQHEMSYEQHAELLALVSDSAAYIAISGYPSDLYNYALSDWFKASKSVTIPSGVGGNHASVDGRAQRVEVLWMNYNIERWRPSQGNLLEG